MAKVSVANKTIEYNVRESTRAKKVRLTVYCDGSVVLTHPVGVSENRIIQFLKERFVWIEEKLARFRHLDSDLLRHDRKHYLEHREVARELVQQKLEYWNQFYNLSYNQVSIRPQKTRWGSCSSRRNLSFNYKIVFLSEELQDYLIVHELCHLQEMNHGIKFWKLVEKTIPNARELQKKINFKVD